MRLWKRRHETGTDNSATPAQAEQVLVQAEPPAPNPAYGVVKDSALAQCVWRTLRTPVLDRQVISADQMGELTELDLGDVPIATLAGLEHASRLRELDLDLSGVSSGSDGLWPLAGLSELRTLTLRQWKGDISDHCSGLGELTEVHLHGVSTSVGRMPDSLEWLRAHPRLKSVSLHQCYVELAPLADLAELKEVSLKNVYVRDPEALATLSGLIKLKVSGGYWLRDLSALTHLPKLSTLELAELDQVSDLGPVRDLVHLTSLRIVRLDNVRDLGPIGELPQLRNLALHGPILPKSYGSDPDIVSLSPVDNLTGLEQLSLKDWTWRCRDFPSFVGLRNLQTLELWDVPIQDLEAVGALGLMTDLSLWNLRNVTDGRPLAALHRLAKLNLFDVPLASLHPVSELTNLMDLAVGYSNRYRDSATADLNLTWLTQLQRLSLHGLPLHSLYSLRHLSALKYVHLSELPATDIDSLAHLASLEDLSMRDLDIDSLQPIASLRALTSVDLWSLPISSISPLAGLSSLTYVGLLFLRKINDLTPLSKLTQVTRIELSGLDEVSDLSPLKSLPNLMSLRLGWMGHVDESAVEDVPRVSR